MSNKVYHVNELIESHMYLVPFVMNKYFSAPNQDVRDELMSIGYEALVLAAQKYDPEIAKFSTFGSLKVRYAMSNHFRKISRRKQIVDSFSIDFEFEEGATFHELIGDDSAVYEESVVSKIDIEQWLSGLSEEERQIISLFVGLEEEQAPRVLEEIGETIGVSRDAVWRRKKKAIEKLRAEVSA